MITNISRRMEDILKNARSFIDVLGMSRSSMIQQWDTEALHRSFKWAAYFEQVHQKIAKKERLKLQLIQQLEQERLKANLSLGFFHLKFEDLKEAKRILTRNILQNVWCPLEIYTETIKLSFQASDGTQPNEILSENFKAIFRLQKLSTTLKSIGTSLTKDSLSGPTEDGRPSLSEETQSWQQKAENDPSMCKDKFCCFSLHVDCRLFRTYVIKSLRHNNRKDEIWRKIEPLALSENGQLVIVHSVSNRRDEESPDYKDEHDREQFKSFVMEFIAETDLPRTDSIGFKECLQELNHFRSPNWFALISTRVNLVPKWKTNPRGFLQLPADVLVDLAVTKDFLRPYLDTLFHCCEWYDLETQRDDILLIPRLREKTPTAVTEERSLVKITSHFHELQQRRELDKGIMYKYKDHYNAKNKRSIPFLLESTFNELSNKYFPCQVGVA